MSRGFDTKTREILRRELPLHTRRGQGGTYKYHKGSDIIRCLNDAFGHSWSSEKIEEKVLDEQVLILAALTVMTEQGDTIVHHGYGSADIKRHSSTGKVLNIGNVYKSAFTNAVKKAAEQFGIGLGEDDEDETSNSTSSYNQAAVSAGSKPAQMHRPTPMPPRQQGRTMARGAPMKRPEPMPVRKGQDLGKVAANVMSSPPVSAPEPMKTPDLGNQIISDTQKKALRNLASMKKRLETELVEGALPGTGKTSFDQLLKSEAIEVIKFANSLPHG